MVDKSKLSIVREEASLLELYRSGNLDHQKISSDVLIDNCLEVLKSFGSDGEFSTCSAGSKNADDLIQIIKTTREIKNSETLIDASARYFLVSYEGQGGFGLVRGHASVKCQNGMFSYKEVSACISNYNKLERVIITSVFELTREEFEIGN